MSESNEQEALVWKKMYEEDGLTIEGIALEVGRSQDTVKRWLSRVNTKMRKPGGSPTYRNKAVDGIKEKSEDKITKVGKTTSYTGHRRRRAL